MSDSCAVELNAVTFFHGDRCVLDKVSLKVKPGKLVAVMGPSGCGKTTLLRLMTGQYAAHSGEVQVLGRYLHKLSPASLQALRQEIGMLFQSAALLNDLSVFDNVAFPLREHTDLPEALIQTLVLMKLQAVGLRGARHLMPSALSGGMARRVGLARAMALDPRLLFLDEPFTGQDPISMGVLMKLIQVLNQELGMTIVLVSHDVEECLQIADDVYLMAEGRVVAEGTPEALQAAQQPQVHQFIHGLPDGAVPFHYPACEYADDLFPV